MQFPQLFIKSNLSFLDSAITVEDIIEFAIDNKHQYAILTESKHISAFPSFYFEAIKHQLIPICSLHFLWNKSELLLIAKNLLGYQNLLKISNTQVINEEDLKNIIVIHIDGEKNFDNHSDFYIANCNSDIGVYIRENKFKKSEDYDFFAFLASIKNQNFLEDELQLQEHEKANFLYQEDLLSEIWEKNLQKILTSCELFDLSVPKNNLSFFDHKAKTTIEELSEIAFEELKKHIELSNSKYPIYLERLKYEIEIIKKSNFADYFFIVFDFVNYAKKNKILIGIGRGSVCGSLFAFLLKITGIDPIEHNLYFERFLNLKRLENPDIDIDVDSSKREEIISYLKEKYGQEHVCLLSVIQKFKFKSAFIEVLRSLNIDTESKNKTLFLISKFSEINEELTTKLENYYSSSEELKQLLFFTKKLINWPKSLTVHPAGIIIFKDKINDFLSLISKSEKNVPITFYTSDIVQEIGMIKFDLLSLSNLELIDEILKKIKEKKNKELDIFNLDWTNEKVFGLLGKKYTKGIFQLEGEKMTEIVGLYKPKSILDLSNIISLLRPGAYKQIDTFLNIKNRTHKPYLIHEELSEILKNTSGLIIYQEQIMEIVSKVTKCAFSESDLFRKAIAKKNKNKLLDLKKNFFDKGILNGFTQEELDKIWNFIDEFANFGFNKSHAIAYAKIAYQLAWLKFHYPQEFFASLLKVFGSKTEYLKEMYQLGFSIVPPNINNLCEDLVFNNKTLYWPITKMNVLNEAFFQKLKDLMAEKTVFDNLLNCIQILINKKFAKEEILFLNEIKFFNVLFNEKESNDFLIQNIDEIYDSVIFVGLNNKNLNLNYSPSISSFDYEQKMNQVFSIKFLQHLIPHSVFQKHNAKKLLFLSLQEKPIQKYIGFIKSIKQTKKQNNDLMHWLEIYGCNYSLIFLPFFSSISSQKSLIESKTPFLFSIAKYKNKLKIQSFQLLKNE